MRGSLTVSGSPHVSSVRVARVSYILSYNQIVSYSISYNAIL